MNKASSYRTSAKIRSILEVTVNALAFSIFIFIALICIYGIFDMHQVETSSVLDADLKSLTPDKTDDSMLSIDELQKINPEIQGWLTIDGTNIDFPVVHTTNNSKYLSRNYRNEYSVTGAAFLDYQNAPFTDDYSVIYGHRATRKVMFSEITSYKEQEYFDAHRIGTLYTADEVYDLKAIGFAIINATSWHYYDINRVKNSHNNDIISYMKTDGHIVATDEYKTDKLLLLSTCDKDSKHYRNILLLSMTVRGSTGN